MCGISGWILNKPDMFDREHLQSLVASLEHRGPDDTGVYFDSDHHVALGHNRLRIVDLSRRGQQPMLNKHTGDVLSFNGEIYNFQVLRRELENMGYAFRSSSDTEVLLYAFAAWGETKEAYCPVAPKRPGPRH